MCKCCYLFLYVLQQKGGCSQVVHRDVEEALNLFLMEVHGDQVGETYIKHGQLEWQHTLSAAAIMDTHTSTSVSDCPHFLSSRSEPWNNPLPLTSFTHHGGDKLGDDGASLPHLTLLAVGEVGEDACDAPGTGRPARIHHDQHLHYGGVHIPDRGERRRGKMKEDRINRMRCFKEML